MLRAVPKNSTSESIQTTGRPGRTRVLVVDNRGDLLLHASRQLSPMLYVIEAIENIAGVLDRVQATPLPDVVILDTSATSSPERVITELRSACPLLKIVVQVGDSHLNGVVRFIELGANGCVWKPLREDDFTRAIHECPGRTDEQPSAHQEVPGDVLEFDDGAFFVAASPAMRKLRADLDRVAKIDVPVLCLGESGTGKEVAAKWLHKGSARSDHAFLKVNCAAVPAELLESELFGYERGAFTGAVRAKPGKFELCNGGTIFLDEIAEMPAPLQAKLLHVVQDQEFARLGGCRRVKVTVRVIGATNVDIEQAMADKRFREDLYYRLSVFVFEIPPLRERREDIPILLRRYMAVHAHKLHLPERALSNHLWQRCLQYEWPGNIRQLENFAKRYLLFGEEAGDFENIDPPQQTEASSFTTKAKGPADLKEHVRELRDGAEAAAIANALEQTNWNRRAAAKALNISYKSMLSKIRQHGLDRQRRHSVE